MSFELKRRVKTIYESMIKKRIYNYLGDNVEVILKDKDIKKPDKEYLEIIRKSKELHANPNFDPLQTQIDEWSF